MVPDPGYMLDVLCHQVLLLIGQPSKVMLACHT